VRPTYASLARKVIPAALVLIGAVAVGVWIFRPSPTKIVAPAPDLAPTPRRTSTPDPTSAIAPGDDIKRARDWARANCPDGTILAMQTLADEVQWMCADQNDRRHGPFLGWHPHPGVEAKPTQPAGPATRGTYRRGSPLGWILTWKPDGTFDLGTCTSTGVVVQVESDATSDRCPMVVSSSIAKSIVGAWCHVMDDQLLLSCHEQQAECRTEIDTYPADKRPHHRCEAKPTRIHCFEYVRKSAIETNCYATAEGCDRAWNGFVPSDLVQKSPDCTGIDLPGTPPARQSPGLECKTTLAKDLAIPKSENSRHTSMVRMKLKCPKLHGKSRIHGHFNGQFEFATGIHNRLTVSLCYGPTVSTAASCETIGGTNHSDSGDTIGGTTGVTLEADFAQGSVGYLLIGVMSNPGILKTGASLRFTAIPSN
jgi:hypothetical protein